MVGTKRPTYLTTFRGFLAVVAVVAVSWCGNATVVDAESAATFRFKAIAFDYFVLFNPDSVVSAVERIFPGKGRELTNLWRTRQFEYSWLRSITNRYGDFFAVTEEPLRSTGRGTGHSPGLEFPRFEGCSRVHAEPRASAPL
jgi:hypothetical protein